MADLAEALVGDADDRDLGDRVPLEQLILDLGGKRTEATAVVRVLQPVDDPDRSLPDRARLHPPSDTSPPA